MALDVFNPEVLHRPTLESISNNRRYTPGDDEDYDSSGNLSKAANASKQSVKE